MHTKLASRSEVETQPMSAKQFGDLSHLMLAIDVLVVVRH
jgi:hypothetical protein